MIFLLNASSNKFFKSKKEWNVVNSSAPVSPTLCATPIILGASLGQIQFPSYVMDRHISIGTQGIFLAPHQKLKERYWGIFF